MAVDLQPHDQIVGILHFPYNTRLTLPTCKASLRKSGVFLNTLGRCTSRFSAFLAGGHSLNRLPRWSKCGEEQMLRAYLNAFMIGRSFKQPYG